MSTRHYAIASLLHSGAKKNRIGGHRDSKTLPDVSQDIVAVGLMMNFFYKFTAVSDSEGLLTVIRCFVHLQVGIYVFVHCRSSSVFPPRCTLLYSVSQSISQSTSGLFHSAANLLD